ncbi:MULTISPECIES: type II secretion system F family protein [Cupriavidus]|uniref:type II secretion system F family protein n=1 Tax=Cupriavidus TaxID=106589 RepID=UPI00035E8EBC|nr:MULTISPECIES: type II secretion system F family protein [Cupriavidus]
MNQTFAAFGLSLFIAIVLAVVAGYQWWQSKHSAGARRLGRRVRAAVQAGWQEQSSSIMKERALSSSASFASLLRLLPRIHALDRLLMQSGLNWTVSTFLCFNLLPALAICAFGMLMGLPAPAVGIAALCSTAAPLWFVLRRRSRRLQLIETQLPEGADLISRALRAGHSFSSALDMAGDELPDPLGAEFRLTFDELNFGASMHDALNNMAARAPLPDLRYLVIAVLIQRESGGNLAEILGNVARIIRERMKLLGQVRVLSAEGRFSGIILAVLPFALAGAMYLLNPTFLDPLANDPIGPWIVGYAVLLMLLGLLWMRKIVRIHM